MAVVPQPTTVLAHAVPGRAAPAGPRAARAGRGCAPARSRPRPPRRAVCRVNAACASVVIECEPAVGEDLLRDHVVENWLNTAAPAMDGAAPTADVPASAPPPAAPSSRTTLLLSLAALALSFLGGGLPRMLALVAISRAATPGLRHAITEAVSTRRPTVALLDAAVLVIMLLTGDMRGAALTHLLVLVGEAIRARTARQTRRGTLDLGQTLGRTGWLVLGNEQVRVPTERLQPDDVVAVHAGEQVPVDGVVVAGEDASINAC